MYQNYIFDLYGTLVDIHTDETVRGLWKQMAELYTRRGAAYRPEELRETYEMLCREETKKKGSSTRRMSSARSLCEDSGRGAMRRRC